MRSLFNGHLTLLSSNPDNFILEQSPYYETEDEIKLGIEWGFKKAYLLKWVKQQMLTPLEHDCIELYYFKALTYREVAQLLNINPSTVYRNVKRAKCIS